MMLSLYFETLLSTEAISKALQIGVLEEIDRRVCLYRTGAVSCSSEIIKNCLLFKERAEKDQYGLGAFQKDFVPLQVRSLEIIQELMQIVEAGREIPYKICHDLTEVLKAANTFMPKDILSEKFEDGPLKPHEPHVNGIKKFFFDSTFVLMVATAVNFFAIIGVSYGYHALIEKFGNFDRATQDIRKEMKDITNLIRNIDATSVRARSLTLEHMDVVQEGLGSTKSHLKQLIKSSNESIDMQKKVRKDIFDLYSANLRDMQTDIFELQQQCDELSQESGIKFSN